MDRYKKQNRTEQNKTLSRNPAQFDEMERFDLSARQVPIRFVTIRCLSIRLDSTRLISADWLARWLASQLADKESINPLIKSTEEGKDVNMTSDRQTREYSLRKRAKRAKRIEREEIAIER